MEEKIKNTVWYTPNEIIESGVWDAVTKASFKTTKQQMLLRFIREKRLLAKNLGTEQKPRYVVLGKNLKTFINRKI